MAVDVKRLKRERKLDKNFPGNTCYAFGTPHKLEKLSKYFKAVSEVSYMHIGVLSLLSGKKARDNAEGMVFPRPGCLGPHRRNQTSHGKC